jgi:Fur family ferric uptake transcriptional regulator
MASLKQLRETAREQIRLTGARVTSARIAILAVLREAVRPLSASEVEAKLGQGAVDRVTAYRVLEWLTVEGLARRVVDASGVYRFEAMDVTGRAHAHFHCDTCGKVYCLDEVGRLPLALPRGFRSEGFDVTVRGRCARCAA